MNSTFATLARRCLSTGQGEGKGAQPLDFFNVNVDDGIAARLTSGNSHHADATLGAVLLYGGRGRG
jgi:hypothetical protein